MRASPDSRKRLLLYVNYINLHAQNIPIPKKMALNAYALVSSAVFPYCAARRPGTIPCTNLLFTKREHDEKWSQVVVAGDFHAVECFH